MEIKKIVFRKGIKGSDDILKENKTHLAFYGYSNVGKSSCINSLLSRRDICKSSSKPGKTKEINFFEINDSFFMVDLPGYGYAKLSQKEREKLRKLIAWYILKSEVKKRINILIIDIRIGLRELDYQLIENFLDNNEKIIILANKIDKLKQKDRDLKINKIFNDLKIDNKKITIIPFSALKKKGVQKFWEIISFDKII